MSFKNFLIINLFFISINAQYTGEDLDKAVYTFQIDKVKEILDSGVDVNSRESLMGGTPLITAVATYGAFRYKKENEQILEIIKLLLDYNADPTIKNRHGVSSIEVAKRGGDKELIKLLEDFQKKKLAQQKSEKIFTAIESLDYDAIKKFSKEVSFIYVKDANGNNPLHKSVSKGDTKMVAYILSIQPQLARLANNRGQTPIDIAASKPVILSEFLKLGYKKKN